MHGDIDLVLCGYDLVSVNGDNVAGQDFFSGAHDGRTVDRDFSTLDERFTASS
jgi:hypothetical protein